jgi:hypothetical protein
VRRRAARRFPIILEGLAAGELTLASVKLLAPHLTPENHADVLTRARHQSKREVELLVAALHPQPDVPSVIRKLPAPRPATSPAQQSEARAFLEYHHVVPFAAGGETSAKNLELRCRAHNQYEADRYFGPLQVPLVREARAVHGDRELGPGTSWIWRAPS